MPSPDVMYFLDCSVASGHIGGDTYHYFTEESGEADSFLDYLEKNLHAPTSGDHRHMRWLELAGLEHERGFIEWRNSADIDAVNRVSLFGIEPTLEIINEMSLSVAASVVKLGHRANIDASIDHVLSRPEEKNRVAVISRAMSRSLGCLAELRASDILTIRAERLRKKAETEARHRAILAEYNAANLADRDWVDALDIDRYLNNDNGNEVNVSKVRRELSRASKLNRGVIKRSARFLSRLIGSEMTRIFVGGESIRVEGKHAIYELSKKSSLNNSHGGFSALSVYHKDHPDLYLCGVCIYTEGVPLLDHVASLIMLIKTGNEEDILEIGNATMPSPEAYNEPWLAKHLPTKMDLAANEIGLGIMRSPFGIVLDRPQTQEEISAFQQVSERAHSRILETAAKKRIGVFHDTMAIGRMANLVAQ